jgi:hypothetical protein
MIPIARRPARAAFGAGSASARGRPNEIRERPHPRMRRSRGHRGSGRGSDVAAAHRKDSGRRSPSPGAALTENLRYANVCSMTSQPRPLAQLQRALRTGNLEVALAAAASMPRVSLEDAFAICLLLRADGERYERACIRWLERFAAEVDRVTLADVQRVAAGFREIGAGAAARDLRSLDRVLRAHHLHRAADRVRSAL